MRHLGQDAFVREIQQRYGGIPSPVLEDAELLTLLLPALRGDVVMMETYSYSHEAPLGCPVTAYGGVDDRTVTKESLEAWREQTTGAFSLKMVPGDHFCLPAVRAQLAHALESAREGSALSAC